jgi:hypothetical protein
MGAVAWCRLAENAPVALSHGDLVGRSRSAALVVEDPRVSEAHAWVSLRNGALRLLALRGRFRIGGALVNEVDLEPGQVVELADGLALTVEDVRLSSWILGIESDQLPRQPLPGTVTVQEQPTPRLKPGAHPDGLGVLWNVDDEWRFSTADGMTRAVAPGDRIAGSRGEFRLVALPLDEAGVAATAPEFTEPIRLEASFATVTATVRGAAPVVIGGLPGRILAELVALARPVAWTTVAEVVWPDETDRAVLRSRWDVNVSRLRTRLRRIGARPDLFHQDGAGQVRLILRDGDEARCDATATGSSSPR